MAKSIYLTSASAVTSNQSVVDVCVTKQALPELVTAQLGQRLVALPTNNLGASIWAVVPREDGSFALKVSIYGYVANGVVTELPQQKSNFKIGGWLSVYPQGVDAPESARILSEPELKGLLSFSEPNADGSKKSLWFDLDECSRVYLVPALVEEKHYVLDQNGNRIPNGTDAAGRQQWQLGTHLVLGFPACRIDAPIIGSGVGSSTITDESIAQADALLDALLAANAARSL